MCWSSSITAKPSITGLLKLCYGREFECSFGSSPWRKLYIHKWLTQIIFSSGLGLSGHCNIYCIYNRTLMIKLVKIIYVNWVISEKYYMCIDRSRKEGNRHYKYKIIRLWWNKIYWYFFWNRRLFLFRRINIRFQLWMFHTKLLFCIVFLINIYS